MLGGPASTEYLGGPKCLGGPNFNGGTSNPCRNPEKILLFCRFWAENARSEVVTCCEILQNVEDFPCKKKSEKFIPVACFSELVDD